jgi:hypothetical protein
MTSLSVVTLKLVALLLSLAVAYLAFYAYRRSESAPMLYVSAGFVFIGVGAVCEGLILGALDTSMFSAALIQTVLVSTGMVLILRSITLDSDRHEL